MRAAALVELVVRVTHRFRPRFSEHHLEIDGLEPFIDVAVDHAGRTGDALPGSELDVDALSAFVLYERGQVAFQYEKKFFHLMGVRRVALPGLDVHDAQG